MSPLCKTHSLGWCLFALEKSQMALVDPAECRCQYRVGAYLRRFLELGLPLVGDQYLFILGIEPLDDLIS